jgi:hypothetical protein
MRPRRSRAQVEIKKIISLAVSGRVGAQADCDHAIMGARSSDPE